MQIIFLHPSGPRSLKISIWLLFLISMVIFSSGAAISWLVQSLWAKKEHAIRAENSVSEPDLSVIVGRLGQLQAHVEQLDNLSTRLGQALGVKVDLNTIEPALPNTLLSLTSMKTQSLTPAINAVARRILFQQAVLNKLEDTLAQKQLQALSWPTRVPVPDAITTSGFGWRIDPFTGARNFHDGMDLAVPAGSAILAAAPGKIVFSGINSSYGLMAEIDHGQGIRTRYAHAQRFFVQPGDLVRAGQQIGTVGNSGRSTGSHLHFEIRINGIAQNPQKFLGESRVHLLARLH